MRHISSLEELTKAFDSSSTKPVMLFKHSTRCSLSATAYSEYKAFVDAADPDAVDLTYLDLLAHRDVSNAIEERTGIRHASPQAILLVDGAPVWNTSHMDLTKASLEAAVKALGA